MILNALLRNLILIDQISGSTSMIFRGITTSHGIRIQFVVISSHNSIEEGKQYHQSLQLVLLALLKHHYILDIETTLRISIKFLNNTIGPNGLVPTLLGFETFPTFQQLIEKIRNERVCINAMRLAQTEAPDIVENHLCFYGNTK